MKLLRKNHNNESGGASVVVVIVLMLLIILALSALVTAASSEKLTSKTQIWLTEYYELENTAMEKLITYIEDEKPDENKLVIFSTKTINDKWIEVEFMIVNDEIVIKKWHEKQLSFIYETGEKFFNGQFED
ncbi:MAG: hypothetical protein KAG94_05750 [Clostridiales bacterium]|nr:hypothetical protein [Clostridiales bacterium]